MSATAAHEIDKNVRHNRRWLEQVTGREINTVLFTSKQFCIFKIQNRERAHREFCHCVARLSDDLLSANARGSNDDGDD
jgi:hypothetical protein